ncbi:MAG TPA: serine hydrolase [Candidatus Paceibacterota bacterium]|nr:serine hydrolase [Candidatus Paceibacterota bacterium]
MTLTKKWQGLSSLTRSPKKWGIGGFVLGIICGGILISMWNSIQVAPHLHPVRESDIASSSAYMFTDPLISVSSGNGNPAPEYVPLTQKVNLYIASQQKNGLTVASVSFRDISSSDGFIINPTTLYDPASLTKIPLAMAYYALAQTDPSVLSQRITDSGIADLDANEQIESPTQLTPGQSYTVEEMIEHMLKYSDNNAEQLLANHLSQIGQLSVLENLFADLGIKNNPSPDNITVSVYSLFLRVLYNSTYLDRDYSEKLLKLLSEGDFTQGISAGVPQGTIVAQKFGDARIADTEGKQVGAELQNCGIVYYPGHPYTLCVMTKGSNITVLEQTIAGISQIVYQDVSQKYPSS